ncbi:MAG: iron-containing alcohol dehydrogenase, partial [Pseudomonadota bacterium]
GSMHHTHHGTTNAVVMQAVLAFNRPAIEDKIALASAYLGIEGGFDGFYAFVGELNRRLDIPATVADMGVTDPDREAIIEGALNDPTAGSNPVPLTRENLTPLVDSLL